MLSFLPTVATDIGGDLVWVSLQYFQYPLPAAVVQMGHRISMGRISDLSDPSLTLLSFITPSGLDIGPSNVQIYPFNCTRPCAQNVSFVLFVKSAKDLILVLPLPTSGSFQQLSASKTFPPIQVQNIDTISLQQAKQITGTIFSRRVGMIQTDCAQWSTRDNITFSFWLVYPSDILQASDRLKLQLTIFGDRNLSVSTDFLLFDAIETRVVSVSPAVVPTVLDVAGTRLDLMSRSIIVLSNFPPNRWQTQINLVFNSSSVPVNILDMKLISFCTTDINCNRTSITLSLPAATEEGSRGLAITVSGSKNFTLMFDSVFQYSKGCDYDSFCGSMTVDRQSILASPGLSCDSAVCVDPAIIPDPTILSFSPTKGFLSGGTVVEVVLQNLPAFNMQSVSVFLGSVSMQIAANVVFFESNGTLKGNSARIQILTPSAPTLFLGDQPVQISSFIGSMVRTVDCKFRYIQQITGPPVILDYNPKSILLGSRLKVSITVANMMQLDQSQTGYDTSGLQQVLTDPLGTARNFSTQISSSDQVTTIFSISVAKCDIAGIWKVEIKHN